MVRGVFLSLLEFYNFFDLNHTTGIKDGLHILLLLLCEVHSFCQKALVYGPAAGGHAHPYTDTQQGKDNDDDKKWSETATALFDRRICCGAFHGNTCFLVIS
jgi:hypothetical protein